MALRRGVPAGWVLMTAGAGASEASEGQPEPDTMVRLLSVTPEMELMMVPQGPPLSLAVIVQL